MIHISKFAYFSIVVTLFSFSGCKESGSEVSDSTPDVQVEFVDTTPGLRDTIDSRMSELEYTDAEKAEVWPVCVEYYHEYDDYQKRTDRNIPVFVCEPR